MPVVKAGVARSSCFSGQPIGPIGVLTCKRSGSGLRLRSAASPQKEIRHALPDARIYFKKFRRFCFMAEPRPRKYSCGFFDATHRTSPRERGACSLFERRYLNAVWFYARHLGHRSYSNFGRIVFSSCLHLWESPRTPSDSPPWPRPSYSILSASRTKTRKSLCRSPGRRK